LMKNQKKPYLTLLHLKYWMQILYRHSCSYECTMYIPNLT
jgi:hypothetical protein